jgi:hypothetical protein
MATGRDATDVALSTSFGASQLVGFRVITEEVPAPEPDSVRARPVGGQPQLRIATAG